MMYLGTAPYDPNTAPTFDPNAAKNAAIVSNLPLYLCSDGVTQTTDATLASCPLLWWQQWYFVVPVVGLVGYLAYKKYESSKTPKTTNPTPSVLSGLFGFNRRRRKR